MLGKHGKLSSTIALYPDRGSLIPRPSPAPVFDRLQYAKTEPEDSPGLLGQFLHTASDQKPDLSLGWSSSCFFSFSVAGDINVNMSPCLESETSAMPRITW